MFERFFRLSEIKNRYRVFYMGCDHAPANEIIDRVVVYYHKCPEWMVVAHDAKQFRRS